MWFRGEREYVGYHLDYRTEAEAGEWGLSPVLYQCGADWYIAAVRCRLVDDYPYSGIQELGADFYTRHYFDSYPDALYFHKITPELAFWLLKSDQESLKWFTRSKMESELAKAGGDWSPSLPSGAKPVPARFLEFARRRLMLVELQKDSSPWYAYPMAGLTFLCVDVPATATGLALYPVFALVSLSVTGSSGGEIAFVESILPDMSSHHEPAHSRHSPSKGSPHSPNHGGMIHHQPHHGGGRHTGGSGSHHHHHAQNRGESHHHHPHSGDGNRHHSSHHDRRPEHSKDSSSSDTSATPQRHRHRHE